DPHLQRLSHTCQAATVATKTSQALEGTSLRLPIEKVKPRDTCLPSFDLLLIDHHQAIGMWVWQALEKNGLHHAVDGRVRTDTKRQCDQCDCEKGARLQQNSETVTDILQQIFHDAAVTPDRDRTREKYFAGATGSTLVLELRNRKRALPCLP